MSCPGHPDSHDVDDVVLVVQQAQPDIAHDLQISSHHLRTDSACLRCFLNQSVLRF